MLTGTIFLLFALPEVQPFLAGAYLIGLSKKDGGIRPIAIGDIYRRLTGKCLSFLVKEEANHFFLPTQCVCALGGGEVVIRAWRLLMEEFKNNPEFIGMKIDFNNAFNTVKRLVLLKECFENFPHIYKWVYFFYSQPDENNNGEVNRDGIWLKQDITSKMWRVALVIKAGPTCSGNVKVGDYVMYPSDKGLPMVRTNKKYIFLNESRIFCTCKPI